ncbi:MAG: hypothetical protein M3N53_05645 [Actinomycetota bacterium]|nr:hypothetical protein [Actinomycetota bacterium]
MNVEQGRVTKIRPVDAPLSPHVRWTVGCLVASLAMVGILILVALIAIALSPPTWVQVVLGFGLACGGAVFAWLIATALAHRRARD